METAVTGTLDEYAGADAIEALLDDNLDTVEDEPTEATTDEPDTDEGDTDEPDETDGSDDPESDPEESSDDDPEGDESGEDEPSESDSGITDDTLVDIQIGDDTYEVNFAELRAGYLRQEDYLAKVNVQEAEYLEKTSRIEELEEQLAQELQHVAVMLKGDTGKYDTINWQALKEADPAKYNELRVEATEAKERAQSVVDRKNAIERMHQEAQRLRQEAYLKTQVELAEKLVPGFREPEKFKALVDFGKQVGFTQQEVEGITDARHLLLLNNARLYAEGVVKKKAAMESARPKDELPAVVKPGARKSATSATHQQSKRASARLNSEKSVDAAAAYLMTLDL